jgi:hypothetical protein
MSSSLSSSSCVASYGGVGINGTTAKLYRTDDIAFSERIDGGSVAAGGSAGGGGAGGDWSKRSLSNVGGGIGGGGYYGARGINLSL